jgi:predicted RecA/RadA family phage recombinase
MRDLAAIARECEDVTLAKLQHEAGGLERRLRTAIALGRSRNLIGVGAIASVAAYDAAGGGKVEVSVTGVWELPKASGQINQGAAVWWNKTNHNVARATGSGLFPIGVAVQAAGGREQRHDMQGALFGIPVVAAGQRR